MSIGPTNSRASPPRSRPIRRSRRRSYHSGGVNGLLMDGSVHWYADSINLGVWQALLDPRGPGVDAQQQPKLSGFSTGGSGYYISESRNT